MKSKFAETNLKFRQASGAVTLGSRAARVLGVFILIMTVGGCAEKAGSGAAVTIPLVEVTCTTTRCKANSFARAFIVYTTSSCASPAFGETVAGSTTLTCNGSSCRGTVSAFTSAAGFSANTIPDGFYSVCVVIDFNSNYIGSSVPGEDSTGGLSNRSITNGTATQAIIAFTDIEEFCAAFIFTS